jgi:hypothetical protein
MIFRYMRSSHNAVVDGVFGEAAPIAAPNGPILECSIMGLCCMDHLAAAVRPSRLTIYGRRMRSHSGLSQVPGEIGRSSTYPPTLAKRPFGPCPGSWCSSCGGAARSNLWVIPNLVDQDLCAHSRIPMDMRVHG